MDSTVDGFCDELVRCELLSADEVRAARERWIGQSGSRASSLDRFTAWLIEGGMLTDYQTGVIARGNGDQLRLGPYRILERIGRGKMAGVYRATHDLGTTVAIKILPPSKAVQPEVLARFQREARLALAVRHPNVVRSFHTGGHRSLRFLVMEYLEGETLEDMLARLKRLSIHDSLKIVHDALIGLQAIHEKGLVHRDLKPANIMLAGSKPDLTSLAAEVIPKVLDLGMGRALFDDGEAQGPFELTKAGDTLGSGDYISPEQAKDAHNIDIRSDIYSMGCVLYHLISGQPPFADASPVRQLVRHATEEPRPLAEHTPNVPGGVQEVVNWLLAKDPARRYPTPQRAAGALEMFLAAVSAPKPPASPAYVAYAQWVDTLDVDLPMAIMPGTASAAKATVSARKSEPKNDDDPFIASLRQELSSPARRQSQTGRSAEVTKQASAPRSTASAPTPKKPAAPEKPAARRATLPPPPPPPPLMKRREVEDDDMDEMEPEEKGNEMQIALLVAGGVVGLVVLGFVGWLIVRMLG
jgi:serine/threonine protein kinase